MIGEKRGDAPHGSSYLPVYHLSGTLKKAKTRRTGLFFLCVLGILIVYMVFAYIQEKVSLMVFDDGQTWTNAMFFVFLMCFVNLTASFSILVLKKQDELFSSGISGMDAFMISMRRVFAEDMKRKDFFILSIPYTLSMLSSITSINYLPYPVQVLTKSCKSIAIMFIGYVAFKKRYGRKKLLPALGMLFGMSLFLLFKESGTSFVMVNGAPSMGTMLYGFMLLAFGLMMDGLMSSYHQQICEISNDASPLHVAFGTNFYASVFLLVALIATGKGFAAYEVLSVHKILISILLLQAFLGAIGQNLIFLTIQHFGALTTSFITSARKVCTILLSQLIFGHQVGVIQWIGVFVVFYSVWLDRIMVNGKKRERRHRPGVEDTFSAGSALQHVS